MTRLARFPRIARETRHAGTRSGGGGAIRRSSPSSTARRWRRCASGSGSWSRGRSPPSSTASSCPGRSAAPGADRRGRRGERLRGESRTACATRPAAATPTWRDCVPAGSTRRRTPSCCPPTPTRCAACSTSARPRGSPSSPSAAAPASSAGSSRCAGRHARLVSLDLARLRERRGRPALADRDARRRPARARGGSRAERRGRRPRPLPAVVRVRDDRRLRRDPLRRPGLERLRALRRSGQLGAPDRPGRRPAHAGDAAHRRRARRCASWSSARRASSASSPRSPCGSARSPRSRRYEAWIAEDFEAGAEIVRALAQGPGLPDVIRVSDEEETEVSLALSGPARARPAGPSTATSACAAARGGCLIVVGLEGDEESVARRRALAVRALRRGGAAYLGQGAGRSWEHGRFQGPYLRDTLMEMGAMVETLETSHTWTRLGELHAAVGGAIRDSLAGAGHARPRLLPPLARLRRRRLALLHLHLAGPAAGPRSSSGRRSSGPPARRSSRTRRHDHPPPRGRPRPRPLHGGRGGGDGDRGAARGQGAARPGRDHEPRQADPPG